MLFDSTVSATAALSRSSVATRSRFDSTTKFDSSSPKTEETTATAQSGSPRTQTEELLAKLNEYIEKGPIVMMRERILKSMGISEEELKNLPPEKQNAIEAEIAEKIKEMMLREQETAQTGGTTAVKAELYGALSKL